FGPRSWKSPPVEISTTPPSNEPSNSNVWKNTSCTLRPFSGTWIGTVSRCASATFSGSSENHELCPEWPCLAEIDQVSTASFFFLMALPCVHLASPDSISSAKNCAGLTSPTSIRNGILTSDGWPARSSVNWMTPPQATLLSIEKTNGAWLDPDCPAPIEGKLADAVVRVTPAVAEVRVPLALLTAVAETSCRLNVIDIVAPGCASEPPAPDSETPARVTTGAGFCSPL